MKIYIGTTGSKDQKETLDKMDWPDRILSYYYLKDKSEESLKEFFEGAGEDMPKDEKE